jgi:glycosyltransferase involved in cell wall biosynthesis
MAKKLAGIRIARVFTVGFLINAQLRGQIEALVKEGADLVLISSEVALLPAIPGCRYVSVKIPRKVSLIYDFLALLALWKIFRKERFNIVHSMTPKAGLLCAIAAWFAKVPIRIHTFTGQYWVDLKGPSRFFAKGFDWLVGVLNTMCYSDSHGQREFLIEEGVVRAERLKVLGSGSIAGVDLSRFDESKYGAVSKFELGIPDNSLVLLFVGRITEDKGVNELLGAMMRLVDMGSDVSLILLGPNEMKDSIYLKTVARALKNKLLMPGYSSEPEKYMVASDILILPSYREGFGTVIIEAAAMSVPAISTNIYGLRDAIGTEGGIVVSPRNPHELMKAIDLLSRNPELRKSMGALAKSRVLEFFSMTKMNRIVVKEYVALLG